MIHCLSTCACIHVCVCTCGVSTSIVGLNGGYDPLPVGWVPDPHSVQVSLFCHLPLPNTMAGLQLFLRKMSLMKNFVLTTLPPALEYKVGGSHNIGM